MSKSFSIRALLPLAALLVAGAAAAATPTHPVQEVVRYGDLRLDTANGVKRLHARIRAAAERVCSPLESRELSLRVRYEQCVRSAFLESVAAVRT